MGEIWLTSDTHFCHARDFLWAPRGFVNQWTMNEQIIKNWNEVVAPQDDVYLLGDVMLNDNEQGIDCLKRLKGNIHIILGNHDTDARVELYNRCYNVVDIQRADILKVGKASFYLSHYPTMVGNFDDEKRHPMWCLCGHSHTQDKWLHKQFNCYHCELDAHANRPVNIEQVRQDIREVMYG